MVTVHIPAALKSLTNGEQSVLLSAKNVREVVEELELRFPGMRNRLCVEGRLKPAIAVAIDSRICELGLLEQTPPGCQVYFVPAVSGG